MAPLLSRCSLQGAIQALNSQTSDAEVCIGAPDPHCRQPADARRLQGSLDSTLAWLRPSAWLWQACGAQQPGAAHNMGLHTSAISGDLVPPSQFRPCLCEASSQNRSLGARRSSAL